ncbi:Osteoclast-associated immunoglobulin-like receptor [Cricetulus griseus]|nr:Osteoclast-associated immunoglobulin-like receptor [Cricetulus griseus]
MRVLDSYGDDYRASQFTIVLEAEGRICLFPSSTESARHDPVADNPAVDPLDVSAELAEFFLEEVTLAQGGSYYCRYRRTDWERGVWSQSSNVLELLVTGPGSSDYTQANLIRLGLAGLVLICLGVLVTFDWHSRSSAFGRLLPQQNWV